MCSFSITVAGKVLAAGNVSSDDSSTVMIEISDAVSEVFPELGDCVISRAAVVLCDDCTVSCVERVVPLDPLHITSQSLFSNPPDQST